MDRATKTAFVIVMIAAVVTPITAEDFTEWIPEETGVFPLGWSENGTVLAFGWFVTTQMITNGSQIMVTIQDLVTDEILWQDGQMWEESNVGEGDTSPPIPKTASAAWAVFGDTALSALGRYGVVRADNHGLRSSPTVFEDSVHARIIVDEDSGTYELRAYSDNLGEKRISGGEFHYDIEIAGYTVNRDWTRMAVFLQRSSFDRPFPSYEAVGCHLKAGFQRIGR